MSRPPRVRLEGWLLKKKSKDKTSILFKNENQRWFRIQEVEGSDQSELALCYYGSQKDKEAKGWIYLKDVTHIYDEKKTFTIVSDARTMTLEAQSPPEHMLWVQALGNYCQNASSGIKGKSSGAKEVESYKQDDYGSRNSSRRPSMNNDDHPPVAENKGPSLTSLFSRYAQNTGDKSSFYNGPSTNAHPMPSLHSASEDYEYGEPELTGADQVTSTLDNNNNNNHMNYPNNTQNTKNWKEDHRMKGYRGADVTSSATNRLHKFITKETLPDSGIAGRGREAKDEDDQEEELESLTLSNENPSRARQRRQQHLLQERQARNSKEGRFIKPIDSSFTITADEGKRSDDDDDEEDNERGRGRVQRGGGRGRGYSEEDDDDDPSRSPPRRQTSSRSVREENDSDRGPSRQGANDDDNDDDSRPRRNNSERGSGKRVVKAGAVPLPSNAPPRRARDALVEAEATQKTRRSIDDVLFKRGNESKTISRENSARNSNANDSPTLQPRGGGSDSSSEEEFDIKAEIKKYGPGSHNKEFMESTTSTTASTSSNNTSRPPRFPQPNSNKANPYPTATQPNSYQQPPQRGSTPPPRVSHNPGAQVDRNFVTADWDDEEDEEEKKEEGKQGGGGSGRSKSYYQKTNYGSVQADENWLDENFDDN